MSEQENKQQINNLNINMAEIKKDIENLNNSHNEFCDRNDKEHKEIKKMIRDFIESADKRYSPRYVEKIVIALLITFVGGVAVAIAVAIFKYVL